MQQSPLNHIAAAPTGQPSVRDLSVHHVCMPDAVLPSFSFTHSLVAPFGTVSSSSMVVLTGAISLWSGQCIVSAPLPRACVIAATLVTGPPGVGYSKRSFDLEPSRVFHSLATNRWYAASKDTAAGVSPESRTSAPLGVVGTAPRLDQA